MTNYCSNCGTEISGSARFCTECGTEVTKESASAERTQGESLPVETARSDTMFRVTAGLFVAYWAGAFLWGASGSDALLGLVVLSVPAAAIAMYVDLRDLDEPLWGTRPVVWAIGAVLLYIVVVPVYLYKRWQLTK